MISRSFIVILCASLLPACHGGGSRNQSDTFQVHPEGTDYALLRFDCPTPIYTIVQISDGSRTWTQEFDEKEDPAAGLRIEDLLPGYTYVIRVITRDADGSEQRLGRITWTFMTERE